MSRAIGLNGRSRIFGLFAFFAAVFFAGCFDPVSSSQGTVIGPNVLAVQIAGEFMASRTALPSAPVPATYDIKVSRSGPPLGTLPGASGLGPYLVQLTAAPAVGDEVTVESFDSSNVKNAAGDYTLASSDLGGTSVSVSVILRPLPVGTCNGDVDLFVSFDPGSGDDEITKAELSLYASLADYKADNTPHSTAWYRKIGYNSDTGWTDFAGTNPEIIPITHTGISSGNYVVKIEFFRGSAASPIKVSRLLQAVNVRGGLTTDTWVESGTGTLVWNAFGSSNANLGSDGIKLDGTAIAGYAPAAYTYNIYEVTTSTPADKSLTVTPGEPGQVITAWLNGSSAANEVTLTKSGNDFTGTLTSLQLVNSLDIKVTAPDGLTEKTYTVNISGKEIIDFYFTIGGKHYGVGTGVTFETGSGSISGTTITVTVPYGTDLAALVPTVTHSGTSINPPLGTAWGSSASPHTYRVTAVDGSYLDYAVTANAAPGITISGITVEGLYALTFSGVPASVVPGDPITITISGGVTVSSWYICINDGSVASTGSTTSTVTFNAPATRGFYNVNVFATVGDVDYSGSFALIVD